MTAALLLLAAAAAMSPSAAEAQLGERILLVNGLTEPIAVQPYCPPIPAKCPRTSGDLGLVVFPGGPESLEVWEQGLRATLCLLAPGASYSRRDGTIFTEMRSPCVWIEAYNPLIGTPTFSVQNSSMDTDAFAEGQAGATRTNLGGTTVRIRVDRLKDDAYHKQWQVTIGPGS